MGWYCGRPAVSTQTRSRPASANHRFRLGEQGAPDAEALAGRIDGDPVEIGGLGGAEDRPPAGVARDPAAVLGDEKAIVALLALDEPVVDQFHGDGELFRVEKAGRGEKSLDGAPVGGPQAAANGDCALVGVGCHWLHPAAVRIRRTTSVGSMPAATVAAAKPASGEMQGLALTSSTHGVPSSSRRMSTRP